MKTLLITLWISSSAMALEYNSPMKMERSCPTSAALQRALKSAEQLLAVAPACSEADLDLQARILKLHGFLLRVLKDRCLEGSSHEPVREATRDLVKQATQIHNCRNN